METKNNYILAVAFENNTVSLCLFDSHKIVLFNYYIDDFTFTQTNNQINLTNPSLIVVESCTDSIPFRKTGKEGIFRKVGISDGKRPFSMLSKLENKSLKLLNKFLSHPELISVESIKTIGYSGWTLVK